jgi:DNA-binding FadR family transcriptional regulator
VLPVTEWNLFDPQLIRWRLAGEDRRELLKQLSQLRAAVEPAAAALAATNATAEQCTELLRLAGAMRKQAVAGDLPGFVEADVAFHRLMFLASGNDLFVQVGDVTAQVLHGRAELQLMPPDLQTSALDWHALVAEAVAAGDSGEAERVCRCIVLDSAAELERLLEP